MFQEHSPSSCMAELSLSAASAIPAPRTRRHHVLVCVSGCCMKPCRCLTRAGAVLAGSFKEL